MIGLSIIFSALWLPPLSSPVPSNFIGAFATDPAACRSSTAGTRIDVRQNEIDFAGRREVRELIVLDSETIVVQLGNPVIERRSGTLVEPLPIGEPRNLLVLKRDDSDGLRVKTRDFEIVAIRCERI